MFGFLSIRLCQVHDCRHHFGVLRRITVALILLAALAWNSPAFCGPIHDAAQDGDLERVTLLLKDDPGLVSSTDERYGQTPLHIAAFNDHKDVAELLLASNADVNAKAKNGSTPLHLAAAKGNKDMVELLLANGADVNVVDNDGWSPMHSAIVWNQIDIGEFLRQHGGQDLHALGPPMPGAPGVKVHSPRNAVANDSKAAKFRDDILAAWHAADEPAPFASIRGDFDLGGSNSRQWKTSLQLQDAEKCSLIKTPLATSKSASAWTYACNFHSTGDGYEVMVRSLHAVLNLPFQPDERAANINQVFFVDPSKPARRLFVAKLNASTFGVSVVSVRFAGIAPGRLNAEAFPAVPTMLPAEPVTAVEGTKVVPVQKQPATDPAVCAAYLQRESERTSRQLDVSRLQNELNDLQTRYQTATQQALQSQQLADATSLAGIGQKGWGRILNSTSTALNTSNAQQFQVDAQNLQVQMNLKQSELITAQIAASAPSTAPPPGCAGNSAAPESVAPATAEPDASEQYKKGVALYDQNRYEEARPLLQKACDGGEMDGCFKLGHIYNSGAGVPRDFALGCSLWRKACDGGFSAGCFNFRTAECPTP
jgi:TolA-binding protein